MLRQPAVAKAQGEAAAKQTVINAINEAATKSAEAAKLLPNDKDVAGVVATFTTKTQQLAGELAAIQKAVIADQTTAQQAAQAKLVESYVPADAGVCRLPGRYESPSILRRQS